MGRRKKAAKKPAKKPRPTVATIFKCLFCNHDKAVTCQMDVKTRTGELNCRICDAKFQCNITLLSDPIDVFSEWLDTTAERQAAEGNDRGPFGSLPIRRVEEEEEES